MTGSRALVLLALGAASCLGAISAGPGDDAPGADPAPAATPRTTPGASATGTPAGAPGAAARPAPSQPRAPLRRLSRAQYNNTVRDLLGDASRPADQFVVDEPLGAFAGTEALAQPSPALVEQYRTTAERLAANAAKNLAALLPCKPDAGEEACARAFIDDFGLRAFRRPLATDEATAYLDLYRRVRPDGDFAWGVQALITAMLQSPFFLYRAEPAPAGAAAGTVAPLGPYEVASRLSYFLWNTMPDRDLFATAKAGKLVTAADVEAQARRLIQDPRAADAVGEFFGRWLPLGALDGAIRDPKLFPDFNDGLRRAMREESARFSSYVTLGGDGKLDTLLLSPRSFVNAALGKLYGVAGGADYALTDLNPNQRAGLLTHASLLTVTANGDYTSPTRRGKFVRDQLMCQPPPDPPADLVIVFPRPKAGQTLRERFAEHVANPTCAACHELTDPIGFGFENYDAIGKYRTLDAGKPIDASGEVTASQDVDGAFVGALALARRLAASASVRQCFMRKWFAFAEGRGDEPGDQASVAAAFKAFTDAGTNMRELMVAMTKTDSFRTRLVEGAQ